MSVQYVNKNCPVCGGYVVLLTSGTEICEKCHYVLPNSNWLESTSATSGEKTCKVCGQTMARNTVGLYAWTCPKCGYHYELTTGDPPQDICTMCLPADNSWGVSTIKSPDPLEPFTVEIGNCKCIKLGHKELDIEFELEPDKLENINTLIINGHKYVKEK